MQKKLTVTIDEEVYDGLYRMIGPRNVSRFIEALVRSHVLHPNPQSMYAEAADKSSETEAIEYDDMTIQDIADESG